MKSTITGLRHQNQHNVFQLSKPLNLLLRVSIKALVPQIVAELKMSAIIIRVSLPELGLSSMKTAINLVMRLDVFCSNQRFFLATRFPVAVVLSKQF